PTLLFRTIPLLCGRARLTRAEKKPMTMLCTVQPTPRPFAKNGGERVRERAWFGSPLVTRRCLSRGVGECVALFCTAGSSPVGCTPLISSCVCAGCSCARLASSQMLLVLCGCVLSIVCLVISPCFPSRPVTYPFAPSPLFPLLFCVTPSLLRCVPLPACSPAP
ncbi:unnamed protein product, partial [Pylaiella littoralis]